MKFFPDMKPDPVRAVFARQVLALAGALDNEQLERAFAAVPRERFLGSGPWRILTPWDGVKTLPENDPALICQDVIVALDEQRGVNNGSPVLHARWINAMRPGPGECVVHIGAGAGYYTAILAHLVGPAGRVLAVECDEALVLRLRENLADLANVEVVLDDGAAQPGFHVDCIYVNFCVSRPADRWLDKLNPGGRLVLPLGIPQADAVVPALCARHAIGLLATRQGERFAAASLGEASFVFAQGELAQSDPDIRILEKSIATGEDRRIRSLIRSRQRTAAAWFCGENWTLSFEGPD